MPFLYGDKYSAARVADFPAGDQLSVNCRTVIAGFDYSCPQCDRAVNRRRTKQFDMKFSRYRAWGRILAPLFHQVVGGGPIGMTIQQGSDNAAVKHPRKCLMMRLGVPGRDHLVALGKAGDVKSFLICRPAAEAYTFGRVFLLQR